ncbi:MAG: hypothetical protein IVW52_14880 [Acidimicrobiales bacterium]|nr:hypothetical protein [Acidimicrobiales bacterium]
MAVTGIPEQVGSVTPAGWVAHIVANPDPAAVGDVAAAIGALLAFGGALDRSDPSVRVALRAAGNLPVPGDACCRAAYAAGGLAALSELLAGHDDARRAVSRAPDEAGPPLDERLVVALARHGPTRRADLVRAVNAPPSTVTRALARLGRRGLVQAIDTPWPTPTGGRRPGVTYALTSSGIAIASLR